MHKVIHILTLLAALAATGCVNVADQTVAVRHRASYDFGCPPERIEVTWLQSATYGAEGCRRKQVYVARGTEVYPEGMQPIYVEPRFYGGVGFYHGHYHR